MKRQRAQQEQQEIHRRSRGRHCDIPSAAADQIAADVGHTTGQRHAAYKEDDGGNQNAENGIDVLERVERQPAALADGVVAAKVRDQSVREFMQHNRHDPSDKHGPDQRVAEIDDGERKE